MSRVSAKRIAEENEHYLRRYREFRKAADAVAGAWRDHPDVLTVALMGSLAQRPFKDVPQHAPFRRARIELWHECKDVDLALWLSDLKDLDGLRRAKDRALVALHDKGGSGVASHQLDVFIVESGTDRYLGRLCDFKTCPKGKADCLVPFCGATPFLKQHDDFHFRPDSVASNRIHILFDRATGKVGYAADLPLPSGDDER